MRLNTDEFLKINLDNIDLGETVDKQQWKDALQKMKEMKLFLDDMFTIINSYKHVPYFLSNKAIIYTNTFVDYLNKILEPLENLKPFDKASKLKTNITHFTNWYGQIINGQDKTTSNDFFKTYNTLKNLAKPNNNDNLIEINQIKSKIIDDKNSVDTILEELRQKASEETTSDYAKIFQRQSGKHYCISKVWLGTGITLSLLFLVALLFTGLFEKFPTEEVLFDGKTVKYNISNLLIKLIMFAVPIFLISFSFKQYSISKHLGTLNKHRQNGLDSYKLFVETVSKDDTETRNALMLQLAKAIYEQTSTGYISDKNQNVNSGIIEVTKMLGANKPGI